MARAMDVEKQFALSLAALVVLVVAGVVLGLLIPGRQMGLVFATAAFVLAVFAAIAYLVVYRPLQVLVKLDEELSRAQRADALTGLLTDSQILDRLEREMDRALRKGDSLACALVEIDSLNKTAEMVGQEAGNSILRSVGGLVAETCRQYDAAGRRRSGEFLIVLPATELDNAARAAERLRRRIEASEFACHGEGFTVTVSIGVAQADTESGETVDNLLGRAEQALQLARQEGRNRVVARTTLAAAERAASSAVTPNY